jgi:hypothetical protein
MHIGVLEDQVVVGKAGGKKVVLHENCKDHYAPQDYGYAGMVNQLV